MENYVRDTNDRWHLVSAMHHSVITDSSAETYCGKIITLPSNDWDEL
jgi:hypothetical protein